ncbi:MAG: NAD(+) synthetase, partial [Thaumarchaeota archaeon]|nr:NAD(+) synthetase [Nitrososphaerota archaeon]
MNRQIVEELIKKDYDSIQNRIGGFLKNAIDERKSSGLVFGLSGGIDSAVIAAICAKFVK